LEQRAATTEILRVISSSPTDVQPVFDAIVASAARLCEAEFSAVARLDDDGLLHLAAIGNMSPAETAAYHSLFPRPPHRGFILGRAFLDGRPVHIEDVRQDPSYDPYTLDVLQRAAPYRTFLGIPIVRDGAPIGVIGCGRREVRPFTDTQVALVQTFAAQAVIAIENVRLFRALDVRNRDLTESLEQQTATNEILRVISSSPTDVQPVFDTIVHSAVRLCDGLFSALFRFDGELIHQVAQHNFTPEGLEQVRRIYPARPSRAHGSGRAIVERAVVHIQDVERDPEYLHHDLTRAVGLRSGLYVPMQRDGEPIGVVMVARAEPGPFSDAQIELLKTFAAQAVIAIENVRLFNELQTRNRELTETLEQQTATSEILRVISSSPTDVRPVFDTIASNARRLCRADSGAVYTYDGGLLHLQSLDNTSPEGSEALRRAYPMEPTVATAGGRAILTGGPVHIPDVHDDGSYALPGVQGAGLRSVLSVPMLRERTPVGVISVHSWETPRPFSRKQIDLLGIFAAQAVIAIQNVHLFTQLQTRNRELTETLEQQTATGEILRVISSSPTDVQPVFDTIARSAAQLCEAEFCFVFRFDGALLHLVAHHGLTPEGLDALNRAWPLAPGRGTVAGRAVLARGVSQIPDVHADPDYMMGAVAVAATFRSTVAVPMMREGLPIGVITVLRPHPGLFSDSQVALLQTFADQAVIAVENVRLFTEVETRNRELTETLEQQTATGEILRVISSSPTDVQPVFDSIAQSARRLCEGTVCQVFQYDGELLHFVAGHGQTAEAREALRRAFSRPPDRGSAAGRSIINAAIVHIPDIDADPDFALGAIARVVTFRSIVAVPMIRDGRPIGVIGVGRAQTGRFSDRQVDLLKTFADQAVIAIQNVRLFQQLEGRNRELTETLEQQTATGEVLRVISSSPTDVQPVFDTIVESAVRLCEAFAGALLRFDGEMLHQGAVRGPGREQILQAWVSFFPYRPGPEVAIGQAVLERRVIHVEDVLSLPPNPLREATQRAGGYRAFLAVPMLRDATVVGVIACWRAEARAFSQRQISLVETFADQAVIAIENVRLFTELEARNRDLTTALDRQTATSEILRVISGALVDVQPVFDTIVASAVRLCSARMGALYRLQADLVHLAAHHNYPPEVLEVLQQMHPRPPRRDQASGRAILDRAVAQIEDTLADAQYPTNVAATFRSLLAVPMLRDGAPIGAIVISRSEPGRFSDGHIALLQTFADQAVIAIENVRLFNELEARTRDLTRSVSELQALGEVSHAVSSTLDLETVLATIVSRAVQLSGSYGGIVYEFDQATQSFHARATHRIAPEYLEALRAAPIRLGTGAVGRAGVVRAPVEVADVESEAQLVAPQVRSFLTRQGMRSLLAVPLVREDRLLGGLVILRRERGGFSPEVVATLQTFAAQSVLAIHNAGLFREIHRQKQYSDALVQTSPVAIATMDLGGTVVGWNPGAERLFGYSETEAMGRSLEDLVASPEIREEVSASFRQMLQGERIRTITRRARKDGTLVDVEISTVPVVVDGAQVGFIATYHDITELLQARREAEAANEAKSAFLATMSHEIRTPMNAVIGMSGLLLNTGLTDEQREYAEIVRQSGDTLLTVINDILDFSKIEAGRLELESQPLDLRECVEGALDLVAARAAEKGLDLAYLLGDGTPAAIVGDVTRLRQILLNLLSNAVKFTERGEVVLAVSAHRLDGATGSHELTFSVRDTGIGIPPDRVGRLFQSFSQVDASTTRRYGGTGLGLAISQRLTELMGGRISVSSEVGVGSEFRFTIRAAAAQAPLATRRDWSGPQPSLRDKRVLVVDDNTTNRRILTSYLGTWGMVARETGSPAEALGWVRAGERFDVAILDMHMPEMDGAALAEAVRQHPAGAALPLILFTSLGRREALAGREDFAAYLHKPIKPSQLFDALVSVLAEQPIHVAPRTTARSELDPEMARRHPLRILLAEDNVVNQKLALRLLGQMGYRADLAANGLEAVEAVARQTYDVVLMDVQMPELDGLEASREINRRWPGARRPRIVAMTANAMQGDRELCEAAGMDDYVAKPIRVEELVSALDRCRPRRGAGSPAAPEAGPGAGDTATTAVIDRDTLDRLTASMGGPFVAELIDTFGEDARELIATLRRALPASDLEAFRRAAHSLKSTSESLGAARLATLARDLEASARAGTMEGAEDRVRQLVDQYELVVRRLGDLRRDLTA
jgi:PAS domain S-box-containing protein